MLQVQQLVKYFGGVHAVDGVSFDVAAGECVALIGPNGAGKSTCFACIAGQYPLTGGHVLWNGKALEKLAPAARLQHGVARTFQVAQVFEALTVLQNVQLTIQASIAHQAISAFKRLDGQSREAASALLQETGLIDVANEDVLRLSYGAKKRLELAMALAARPKLLLLDEPAAGLNHEECAEFGRLLKTLRDQHGISLLFVEHHMALVMGTCEKIIVLVHGQKIAQGTAEEIRNNPAVIEAYLGVDEDAHA